MVGVEWIIILRHAVVFVMGDQAFEEFAFVGFAWDDGRIFGFARLKNRGVGVDAISARRFFSVVTGEAFRDKNWSDVAAEVSGVDREGAKTCEEESAAHSIPRRRCAPSSF